MIERIPDLVNSDANLVRRGRFLSTTFLIEIGDQGYLVKIIEGRIVSVTPGPFVTPNYSFALARAARRMGDVLEEGADARPQRHLRAVQARQAHHRRRPASVHGEPALHQGRAGRAAQGSHRRAKRRRPSSELAIEPALRAHHRPLSQSHAARPAASALYRGGRPGHSAAVPAHRGLRRTAVPRAAQRQARHRQLPRHRVRHAVARQVVAARGLSERGIQAHLARLHPDDPGNLRRARTRQAGGDGLLDRRTHRALSRAPARQALPRHHRAGKRRPCRALLRRRMAAPRRRARRRGLGRRGVRPGRADRAGQSPLGDAVALPAKRPRRVQGRPAFLQGRRRHPRQDRRDRRPRRRTSTCSPASTTIPAPARARSTSPSAPARRPPS